MASVKAIWMYLGWWILWTTIQSALLLHAGFSWPVSLADALLFNSLIALTGYAMGIALRFYQPGVRNMLQLFLWSIGLALLCVGLVYGGMQLVFSAHDAYQEFLAATLYLRFAFAWLMLSFIMLLSWLWFYIKEQQEVEQRKVSTEKLAREAELSKLRQQLQPHFLFNSLNSINALIGSRPEQARKMVQQLSDFLRGTLKKDEQKMVSLMEELQHLQLYLEIEKVRFGHRLNTLIEQDNSCANMLLPALLLQPIMENAIKFGLYDTTGATTIRLQASAEANMLILTTENPFDPATAKAQEGTGFGLNSVKRRLFLLFARHDLLSIRQQENLFITQIKIPQQA